MIAYLTRKGNSRARKRDGQHVCDDGVGPANEPLNR